MSQQLIRHVFPPKKLEKEWHVRHYEQHRLKLSDIKSKVDHRSPVECLHVKQRLKITQREKQLQIDRENEILRKALMRIARGHGRHSYAVQNVKEIQPQQPQISSRSLRSRSLSHSFDALSIATTTTSKTSAAYHGVHSYRYHSYQFQQQLPPVIDSSDNLCSVKHYYSVQHWEDEYSKHKELLQRISRHKRPTAPEIEQIVDEDGNVRTKPKPKLRWRRPDDD